MIITYEVSLDYISITIGKKAISFKSDFLFNNRLSFLIHKIYKLKYENNIPDDIMKIEPDGDTTFYIINKSNTANLGNDRLFNIVIDYIKENLQYVLSIVLEPNMIDSSTNFNKFLNFINFYRNNNHIKPYFDELNKIYIKFLIDNNICP